VKMRWRIWLALVMALCIGSSARAASLLQGGVASTLSDPCNLVTCAEAYSVTRRMISSYSGALFQLHNGTTTLDIGQDANHKADMTTWAAFCPSGVAANCKITKIYAQIQGSANNLSPSQLNGPFGPNCTASATACAAPFVIEVATGLPRLDLVAPYEYTIGPTTDDPATGITGGTSATTVLMNFKVIALERCCGQFGLAHIYNGVQTPGTDFMIDQSYGARDCSSSTTVCLGLDREGASGPHANLTAVDGDNGFFAITFDGGFVYNLYYNNGTPLDTHTSGTAQNSGTRIHLGGGGDLSQPDSVSFREGIITNSQLSRAEVAGVLANNTAFYPALTFR
jgi:hypothetical protein